MTRTSIMVRQLDTNKTAELIKKGYKLTIDITGEPMAVVNTPKGLATICSEGVGWWKNDDGEYLVGYYTEPFGNPSYYMTQDELLSCLSSEEIDLAEFINKFGDRLEVNFDLWYNQIKNVSQDISAFDFA